VLNVFQFICGMLKSPAISKCDTPVFVACVSKERRLLKLLILLLGE